MSGHSHWATNKRAKGIADSKRAKNFSKLLREISVAVKIGGPNIENNSRLKLAVQNAKGFNMPKENIERAIKGSDNNSNYTMATYEGKWLHGIFVIIECLTDNVNRTFSDIKSIFSRNGGELIETGSLSYIFNKRSSFEIYSEGIDIEKFTLDVIEHGGEDVFVNKEENTAEIIGNANYFADIQRYLEEKNIEIKHSCLKFVPQNQVDLDEETADSAMEFFRLLEDNDDVQNVYHNVSL